MSSSRPRASPSHDRALELYGRAEQLARRPRRRPPRAGSRIRLEETDSPPCSTSGTTSVSNSGRPRSSAASPAAPWPKRKFAPDAHVTARPARRRAPRSQKSSADWRESSGVNGIATSSSTPSSDTSSIFRSVVVSSCGGCSGRRTRSGCGSNVTTVGPSPRSRARSTAERDHPPVAEVDAVEGAERDAPDRRARRGLPRVTCRRA